MGSLLMPTEPLFDRERSALRKLQELVRDRAARENGIAEQYQASMAAAETEVAKARRSVASARKKATDEAVGEHETHVIAIGQK
jgi:hypothetical protein